MGMVQLHDQFKTQGFQIMAFPCNQFGAQEPNSNAVIEAFAGTKGAAYGTDDTCGDAQCVDSSGRDAAHGDRHAVCTGGVNGCPFPMFAKSTVNVSWPLLFPQSWPSLPVRIGDAHACRTDSPLAVRASRCQCARPPLAALLTRETAVLSTTRSTSTCALSSRVPFRGTLPSSWSTRMATW